MKTKTRFFRSGGWAAAIALVLTLTGCATPESRINDNPELFASFPPEAQELIRRGDVGIGFTTEMVTMALGAPRRIYSRQTAEAKVEVWSYTSSIRSTDRQRVNVDVRTRDARGRSVTSSEWVYVDVPTETEYEKVRVEFIDGRVSAIDLLQR